MKKRFLRFCIVKWKSSHFSDFVWVGNESSKDQPEINPQLEFSQFDFELDFWTIFHVCYFLFITIPEQTDITWE